MKIEERAQSIDLAQYYYIIAKHKWLILITFILIISITIYFTARMMPVYRATVTIVVDVENKSPISNINSYSSYLTEMISFKTHQELLKSRSVIERVIKKLNFDKVRKVPDLEIHPIRKLLSYYKKNIYLLIYGEEKVLSPEEKKVALINQIRGKIKIEEIKDTRLLKIYVEDSKPERAKEIANILAETYIEFNRENKLKYSQNTLQWMTDQLYELQKRLESTETEFLAYKQKEKLFSVEGRQELISQKITDFNDEYLKTRNERMVLDAKLAQLEKLSKKYGRRNLIHIRSLIENSVIDNLYNQLIELDVELSRLGKIYKAKHPKLVQIRSKIDNTRRKLRDEIQKEILNMKAKRSLLLTRENVLQKTIADFENEALEINKKELKYVIYQRNMETTQKLYNALLSKLKESNISSNIDVSNIRITEMATTPIAPIRPDKRRNILLGIAFGILAGIGLAFFQEYLDQTIRTEEDIQRFLGLPVLTVVPKADRP